MNTRTTVVLAVAAGFVGGIASQHVIPTSVWAQERSPVNAEIRAHRFVLVNDAGVDLGVFGITKTKEGGEWAGLETMDTKGNSSGPRMWTSRHTFLPDATCQACTLKRK